MCRLACACFFFERRCARMFEPFIPKNYLANATRCERCWATTATFTTTTSETATQATTTARYDRTGTTNQPTGGWCGVAPTQTLAGARTPATTQPNPNQAKHARACASIPRFLSARFMLCLRKPMYVRKRVLVCVCAYVQKSSTVSMLL